MICGTFFSFNTDFQSRNKSLINLTCWENSPWIFVLERYSVHAFKTVQYQVSCINFRKIIISVSTSVVISQFSGPDFPAQRTKILSLVCCQTVA